MPAPSRFMQNSCRLPCLSPDSPSPASHSQHKVERTALNMLSSCHNGKEGEQNGHAHARKAA